MYGVTVGVETALRRLLELEEEASMLVNVFEMSVLVAASNLSPPLVDLAVVAVIWSLVS